MGCTRNHSRIWVEWSIVAGIVLCLLIPAESWAAFATQFSLTTGEEYNDNIFFSKSREHDFITFFVPTLTLLYAPEGQVAPTLTANISPSYQIFARNSDLNNFDNVSANGLYTYQYSPRLNFNLSDSFQRLGSTRTSSSGGVGAGGRACFKPGRPRLRQQAALQPKILPALHKVRRQVTSFHCKAHICIDRTSVSLAWLETALRVSPTLVAQTYRLRLALAEFTTGGRSTISMPVTQF